MKLSCKSLDRRFASPGSCKASGALAPLFSASEPVRSECPVRVGGKIQFHAPFLTPKLTWNRNWLLFSLRACVVLLRRASDERATEGRKPLCAYRRKLPRKIVSLLAWTETGIRFDQRAMRIKPISPEKIRRLQSRTGRLLPMILCWSILVPACVPSWLRMRTVPEARPRKRNSHPNVSDSLLEMASVEPLQA